MKSKFIFFALVAFVNLFNNSAAFRDVRGQVPSLITSIDDAAYNLNMLAGNQETVGATIPATSKNIINDIEKNSMVVEINSKLISSASKSGVEECRKMKETGVTNLNKELVETFKLSAIDKINNLRQNSIRYQKRLDSMKNDLQGKSLDLMVSVCDIGLLPCQITSVYPNRVSTINELVASDQQKLNTVMQDTMTDSINPTLNTKIKSQIYAPVSDCLNRLG